MEKKDETKEVEMILDEEETPDEAIIEEEEEPENKLVVALREAGAPPGLIAALVVESEALHWSYLTALAVTERLLDEGRIAQMDVSKIEGQLCQLVYMKMQVSVKPQTQVVQAPLGMPPPPGPRR